MKRIKISASIIAGDLSDLKATVKELESAGVDSIHVDVMDGHFFDYVGPGYHLVKTLAKISEIPVEVHLAVMDPERLVEQFIKAGSTLISVQLETAKFPLRLLRRIRSAGIRSGIAVLPSTPIDQLKCLISEVDEVLLLSNNDSAFMGFEDSEFIPETVERVGKVRKMISERGVDIAVDGGVNVGVIRELVEAGATVLVMGRAVFSGNIRENVRKIRSLMEGEIH